MSARNGRAIVVGASIGGLLATRALSPLFDMVTLIERDPLPDGPGLRKGVPQAGHAHGLLASGYRVLDDYFPGLMEELAREGGWPCDGLGDFLWFLNRHWKYRHESGLRGIVVSRPCLEAAIRRRVRALPNVEVRDSTSLVRPTYDERARRVSGVLVRRGGGHADAWEEADVVVDASGRGSQSPRWLEAWGFQPPATLTVKVDVAYATRIFERHDGDLFGSSGAVISAAPGSARYAAVLAAEGRRWTITLAGMLADHPPADERGWMAFAASLPVPEVHALAATATSLGPITTYRFPANQRRLYERLSRFPHGYLVVGDAVCSFNPIYGQGMSTAALEARTLETTAAEGLDGLARRFYARARRIIDIPWAIATGEDLRFPQVEGPRPPGFALVNRYLDRVHAAAADDPLVSRKFLDVLSLLAPPTSLMRPSLAWRVLARRPPTAPGSPWGSRQSASRRPVTAD